jgi:stage II sporulation protein M
VPDPFLKPYIWAVSFLFLLSACIGFLTPYHYQQEIVKSLLTCFSPLQSSTQFQVFLKIFLNNYISTLLSLLIGVFFGLGPILFLLINGYAMGNLVAFASSKVSAYTICLAILPHGIFEVPAVLLASSYGLWWGVKNYRKMRHKDSFRETFHLPLKRYLNLVVPLLVVGAFVETYVTPVILRMAH